MMSVGKYCLAGNMHFVFSYALGHSRVSVCFDAFISLKSRNNEFLIFKQTNVIHLFLLTIKEEAWTFYT